MIGRFLVSSSTIEHLAFGFFYEVDVLVAFFHSGCWFFYGSTTCSLNVVVYYVVDLLEI